MDVNAIIERISAKYGLKSDADVARFFGLTRGAVSAWRAKGSINLDIVVEKCRDADLNWIIHGSHTGIADPTAPATKADIAELRGFIRALLDK